MGKFGGCVEILMWQEALISTLSSSRVIVFESHSKSVWETALDFVYSDELCIDKRFPMVAKYS